MSVGKEHIYIWEKDEHMLHENEAAQILYAMCRNEHMHPSEVKEGKIEVIADCDGLLKVRPGKTEKSQRAWRNDDRNPPTAIPVSKKEISLQVPGLFHWL